VVPCINNADLTRAAIADCLAQEGVGTPRVLVIQNSRRADLRETLEEIQETHRERVLVVYHSQALGGPPFGTLNATWNRALQALWAMGAEHALVVNNDVRLHPRTYACLVAAQVVSSALFTSAVGVREDDWVKIKPDEECFSPEWWMETWDRAHKGGPDFSCFLISRECHERFPMDPGYTFYGDNDYHRTLVLAGEGERIFGVNVPYLHYGSQTLKRDAEFALAYREVSDAHRARYMGKWGGAPGAEKFLDPRGGGCGEDLVDELAAVRKLQCERPPLR
jgi:hypothetical protein